MFVFGLLVLFTFIMVLHILFYNSFIYWVSLSVMALVLLVSIFYIAMNQIYEYDSNGEVLCFFNANVFLFKTQSLKHEFPKCMLYDFEIVDMYVASMLYIKIKSQSKLSIRNYNVTYMSKKDLEIIKGDLDNILTENSDQIT